MRRCHFRTPGGPGAHRLPDRALLVGVIPARQIEDEKKETKSRLPGVAIRSYNHEHLKTIDDVSKTLLTQVAEFFVCYNKRRERKFRIMGAAGPGKG
jgi:inorganic pyrophosphatase